MTKIVTYALALLSLFLRVAPAMRAQEPFIALERITPDGGLTYSSVMCITEDCLGYMWFGTNNGLFRYDSKQIRRYYHDNNDQASLPVNRINGFLTDSRQKLWIATENGLCLYDRDYDSFLTFHFTDGEGRPSGLDVRTIAESPDGEIWIGDERGVAVADTVTGKVKYIDLGLTDPEVRKIYLGNSGLFWIGFGDGTIIRYDPGSRIFTPFAKHTSDRIMCLYEFDGKLWVGFEREGMDVFDLSGNHLRHYHENGEEPYRLSGNRVRQIVADRNNNLWIGTYQGIDIIRENRVISRLNKSNTPEIPDNSIWSLYPDKEKNLWVGTWQGGVCFYHSFNSRFHYFSSSLYPMSDDLISAFAEDKEGKIWICTQRGGLMVYHPDKNSFSHFPVISGGSDLTNLQSVAIDQNNTVWIGTFDAGVWYLPRGETTFRPFTPLAGRGSQIISILPDSAGIWFCSFLKGLYYYEPVKGTVENFTHDPFDIKSLSYHSVRNALTDSRKNLWVATDRGLNLRLKGSREFLHFFSNSSAPNFLSSNLLYDLEEDRSGNIWIGTNGGGVCRYNRETGVIDNFTMKDGLSGNDVYTVIMDHSGNLWFSTENGLSQYLVKEGEFRSYLNAKGISNNRFNPGSGFLSAAGRLYFGGSNGFVSFDPALIRKNVLPPKVILTNFYLNNQLSEPGQKGYPLDSHISLAQSVTLRFNQNSFSFDFVATNYLQPSKNRFLFRLVGFDREWIETDFTGRATYTNLSPGEYSFEVKAANNDGIWNDVPTTLQVRIKPPLWASWWAILLYAGMVAFIVFSVLSSINGRRKLQQEIAFEKIRRENEDRLHEMKLRFFTNMSHELRTPLTLITGPLQRSLKKGVTPDKREVELMNVNAERLLRLINQILEFRRIESDKVELHSGLHDLVAISRDIFSCFKELAEQKNVGYEFSAPSPSFEMCFDAEKLDMILFNLLSNAFKFTPDGGAISVRILINGDAGCHEATGQFTIGKMETGEFVTISVSDSGQGIGKKELEKIFERFYQSPEHSQTGTGIGLALAAELTLLHKGELTVCSSPGSGSRFILKLPVSRANPGESESPATLVFGSEGQERVRLGPQPDEAVHPDLYGSLIVVVEDHPDLLEYICNLLKPFFTVMGSREGEKGLGNVLNFLPDLVISDILMPGMNGMELCTKIKSGLSTSHIPVVLLTALSGTEDQLRGLKSGADDYITKPFNEEILLVKVNNLLLSRKNLKESFISDHSSWNASIARFDLDRDLIARATKIVESNLLNQNFGVDLLSSELAISRSHLHRKLKSLTDQSGTEFIRYVRVQHSVRLMKEGGRPVNEIGYLSGFNSHAYFTKSFKHFTGYSPSDFIRMVRQKDE